VGPLAIALHHVEPASFERCVEMRDWLRQRGVERLTLLVVPAPRLHPFDSIRPELADWLRGLVARGDGVSQHGLRGREAEFSRSDPQATASVLDAGLRLMRSAGLQPRGFVAPGYFYTQVLRRALPCRYSWWSDLRRVHTLDRSLRITALRPGDRQGRHAAPGRPLRIDVDPGDLDNPLRMAALEAMLARASSREAVTYNELVTGASSRRTTGSRAFRTGAGTVSGPSPAAGAAPPPRR
jgi:uncharacterized protein